VTTTTTTAESVKEVLEEAIGEARDILGDARERIAPLVAEALTTAADKITPDEVQVRITRRPRAPRWYLVAGVAAAAIGVLVVVSRMRARHREEWPEYDTVRYPRDVPGEPVEPTQGKVDRTVAEARSAVSDAVEEASDQLADLRNRPGT
jgi:hypothetical protein